MSSTGALTIDLGAIAKNWQWLNEYTSAACLCGAVVKADAYGLGVEPVAKSLYSVGCRMFFVATLVEAKELRPYVFDSEILVFGGLSHDISEVCTQDWEDYQLTPVLFSVEHVIRWAEHCSTVNKYQSSAIKIDTGMHRLGLQPAELEVLLNNGVLATFNPTYMMSHFACADQPSHPLNQQQIDVFETCTKQVKSVLPEIKLSLCNSSGIFLDDKVHFDVVRPGIALYGGNPTPYSDSAMSSAVQIMLPIMQRKTICEGESVGYGAEFTARRETRIAVVFGGYADGLMRSLLNTGFAFLAGHKVPLIGRVSMDSMVFDITDVSPLVADETVGIEVIGEGQSIDDLASMAGTISYEILTSLGKRYQRNYINVSNAQD